MNDVLLVGGAAAVLVGLCTLVFALRHQPLSRPAASTMTVVALALAFETHLQIIKNESWLFSFGR